MITADTVDVYLIISHDTFLEALKRVLVDRVNKRISPNGLTKIAELQKAIILNFVERSENKSLGLPLATNL